MYFFEFVHTQKYTNYPKTKKALHLEELFFVLCCRINICNVPVCKGRQRELRYSRLVPE